MLEKKVLSLIEELPGKIGVYYKHLTTGKSFGFHEKEPFLAASVIKLAVLIEAYRQVDENIISFHDIIQVKKEDKVPSCGSLNYMHDGLEVTVKDLCVLMIIQSDNTATNILLRLLGIENINQTMKTLGYNITHINRVLFDGKAQREGKENYFAPEEMGNILERLWKGQIISKEASQEMIEIMKLQQINHKIPYFIPKNTPIAHKSGEDNGITHDIALVLAKNPFILCFASNETNVQQTENVIREIGRLCYENGELD